MTFIVTNEAELQNKEDGVFLLLRFGEGGRGTQQGLRKQRIR